MGTRRNVIATALLAAGMIVSHSNVGSEQNEARVKLGMETWKSAGCPHCHGPFADGDKQREDSPSGPNLRERTHHTAETLKTFIVCGRPGPICRHSKTAPIRPGNATAGTLAMRRATCIRRPPN